MTKRFSICALVLTALISPGIAAAREVFLQAECFDESGDGTIVRVYDFFDIVDRTSRLIGFTSAPDAVTVVSAPLRFQDAGTNRIWLGDDFLLRVFEDPTESGGDFIGQFRGRDDVGNLLILRSLSCDLSGWAASDL